MLKAFMIMWTVGAALAAGAVLYVADWRPDLAPDGKPFQSQTAPRQTAIAGSVPRSEARERSDPAATGSVEPARRRSTEAKPNEAKPTETRPTETKATETRATEAKATEAKATEAKATEARPSVSEPGSRRDNTPAEARQPRTVGPPAVLLPPTRDALPDQRERLAPAGRDVTPAEIPAPKSEPPGRAMRLATAAGPEGARTQRSTSPPVSAAPEIRPMEDFEAAPAPHKADAGARPATTTPAKSASVAAPVGQSEADGAQALAATPPAPAATAPAAISKPSETTAKASGSPAPAENETASAEPTVTHQNRPTPQVEQRAPAAPVRTAARSVSTEQVSADERVTEPVTRVAKKREPSPALAERTSRHAARASRRAAKRLALEPEAVPATVRSTRKLRRMARAARPVHVARRGGGLDRVMDDFSRSGADYLHERTYRVSGGYLVERTTRYGSQYMLERTLRPVPW
jgi:hypothetical protein